MPIRARCGRADEIPPGGTKVVQVKDHVVAIFNLEGRLHAIENACPHQGGPLGEGYLEENGVVSCPWHGWTFDVRTGLPDHPGGHSVAAYEVEVRGDDVFVGWLKTPRDPS
jgi:nitrite reductase/ring-hydroxylating ferredoxin subunit